MRGEPHPNPHPIPRRALTRRRFLLGSTVAAAGLALYSNEIARHELSVVNQTYRITNLPPAFHGFRIAQISDIHLEEYAEEFFLHHVIARVNSLAPDLVLITGDYCSRGPLPLTYGLASAARCAAILPALTCPQRYGILGNHDAVVGPHLIRQFLESHGTPVLVNQHVPILRSGQRIWLAGTDDTLDGTPNLDLTIPQDPGAPVLLMVHEPDYIGHIVNHARGHLVSLVLCGHTHGGQVRLPGLRPLLLPPGGKFYPEGRYLVGGLQLYVNRGIGTVGIPFRLNCPPEVTHITLQPA